MKIQVKYPAIVFCATMLAAGCSQEDTVNIHEEGYDTQVPLVITGARLQTEVTETRANQEVPRGTSIGVFLSNPVGSMDYTPKINIQYTNAASSWSPPAEDIRLKAQDANLCAYYPYDASVTDAGRVSIKPKKLTNGEGALAFANGVIANSEKNAINFTMKQACSLLVLNFIRESKDAITLNDLSLTNNGFYKESVLNINDGHTVNNSKADGGMLLIPGEITLPKSGNVSCYIALPPPASLTNGVTISMKVKEYGNRKLTTTITRLTQMEQGYRYDVALAVNGTSLGVTSVEKLEWDDMIVNDGGETLKPIPVQIGISVAENEFDMGDANCTEQDKIDLAKLTWARGNLNSNDDTKPYTWDTPTDYGYYYVWNSLYVKDKNQQSNNTDPCSKLDPSKYGTNWRTPSKNEFDKLSRCSNHKIVTNNGKRGMWFMNKTKGLFLPVAGLNNTGSNTVSNTATIAGYYWSSTSNDGDTAYCLYMESGHSYTGYFQKTSAFSVRCVKGDKQ